MNEFHNKTAVVTGAASGIGLELAKVFASEGMNVVLADIEEGRLTEAVDAVKALGAEALGVLTDVGSGESVAALCKATVDRFGSVQVLCNNAGVYTGGQLWEQTEDDYEWLIRVNQWGIIHGLRHFVPQMISQGDECHIVNTASMAAMCTLPFAGIYHMTKHAVLGLSESLFHELAMTTDKVKVSVLCPELIKTGIATCDRNRPAEYSRPGDVVDSDARQLVMDSINEGVTGGLDPSVMADRVVNAIRSGSFYILSEDGWRDTASQRMDDIRTGRNPVLAPPV